MMPNKVARVLYFSRSAFVLYSRTSSSSEMVDIVGRVTCCHTHFVPRSQMLPYGGLGLGTLMAEAWPS